MSELINTQHRRAEIRREVMASVSMLALVGYLAGVSGAAADDNDRPTVWIELGAQVERLDTAHQPFEAPFFSSASPKIASTLVDSQRPSRYSVGEEGKITFAPEGSNWILSASVRYGRSNAARHLHYETNHPSYPEIVFGSPVADPTLNKHKLGDGQTQFNESQALLDFKAGRDVGMGMFGAGSTSLISFGVRFAQFSSSAHGTLRARPHYTALPSYGYASTFLIHRRQWQDNKILFQASRSLRAIGPSASWDGSVVLGGHADGPELTLDLTANAAVLFGRQRARVHHQTTEGLYSALLTAYRVGGYTHPPVDQNRSRTVTVPNAGGSVGLSLRFPNAKVSLGYRGDFFFNAIDNGIDSRKQQTVGFYGPFATLAIGFGG